MANEEQANVGQLIGHLSKLKKNLEENPVLALLGQVKLDQETIKGLLDQIWAVQGLVGKWRTEFHGSDVAERCASDLEALVIAKEPQNGNVMPSGNPE